VFTGRFGLIPDAGSLFTWPPGGNAWNAAEADPATAKAAIRLAAATLRRRVLRVFIPIYHSFG